MGHHLGWATTYKGASRLGAAGASKKMSNWDARLVAGSRDCGSCQLVGIGFLTRRCGLGWFSGDGVDSSDAFAGVFEGLGAGLGGFPSGGDPFFVLFGVGGTEYGRAEIGGWFLAGGEVGFDNVLTREGWA